MAEQNVLKDFEARMQQERAKLVESTSEVDAFESRMRAERDQLISSGTERGGLTGIQEYVSQQRQERVAAAAEAKRQELAARQDAWTTKLGLHEEDFWFQPVNLAATIRDRAASMEGSTLAAPFNATAALLEGNVSTEAREAFNRKQAGEQLPGDQGILDQRPKARRPSLFTEMVQDGLVPGQAPETYAGYTPPISNEARLVTGELSRRLGGAIKESREAPEGIVDPVKMTRFSEELAWRSDQGLKDLGTAMQRLEDGDLKFGIIDTVSALTGLAMQGGTALVMNPGATAQVVAEQAPQLALAAVSGGAYTTVMASEGMDLLRQGVVNYQKAHNGALPSQEEFEYMATNAFAWTAAMAIGDTTLIKLMTPTMRPAEAVATGLVRSGMNVARHGAAGTAAETLAEGIQTYTEGEATYQPASGFEIYQGTVLGGGAGGAMSGGARIVHEVFGLTEEKAHNAGVAQRVRSAHVTRAMELAQAAAQSGDVSTLVDTQSESFNPLAAVLALDMRLKSAELSAEERTQTMGQIGQVMEAAVASVAQAEQAMYQETREYRTDLQRTLRDEKASFKELADKTTEEAQLQERVIVAMEQQLERVKRVTDSDREMTERSVEMAKSDLEAIKRVHSRLVGESTAGTDVQASVDQALQGSPEAVQQVITLAMANPESVTLEQASALLQTEVLAPEQREFLVRFSEAQAAANVALGTDGVNMEVFQGSRQTGSLGIVQYRSGITAAVQAGDTETAGRLMGLLESFAADHGSKNEMVWQAFRQVEGTNNRLAVIPQEDGSWAITETIPSKKERDESGAMIIHRNSNNKGTLTAIEAEASALQAAQAEMQAVMSLAPVIAVSNAVQQEAPTAVQQEVSIEATPPAVDEDVAAVRSGSVEQEASLTVAPETPVVSPAPIEGEASVTYAPGTGPVAAEGSTAVAQQATTQSSPAAVQGVQPQPAEVDLLGDTVQAKVAETKKKRGQGKVAAVKRAISNAVEPVTQANRAVVNAVTAGIRQGRQRRNVTSEQPLVEVENFLSEISQLRGEEFAQRFLASEMSSAQADLVDLFTEYANRWQGGFEAGLPPLRADNTYYLEDFFQYLRDSQTGAVEQNVWTAMSAGAFGWLVEQGTRSPTNTEESIARMFGNEMSSVPLSMQKRLASVGTREGLLVNQLGRRAAQALGAYALPDASLSSIAKLETALGNRILALLEVEGLVTKTTISDAELKSLMGAEESGDAKIQHYFYALAQTPDAQAQLTQIKDTAKGTQGVIANLFGMEQDKRAPSFTAPKYAQKAIKNTDRGVPKAMRELLAKENKKAHYLRTDAVTLLEALPEQLFLEIEGWIDTSKRVMHSSNSESVKGKNDSAERSLAQAKEFIALVREIDPELKHPFFFSRSMWKPQRVGLEENLFNPQADKLHRLLTGMGGWQTEASLTNAEQMQDFWLAVGEGLGVKTDSQGIEASVQEVQERITESVMVEGIEALMRALNGEVAGDNDAALIKAAVNRGGEKFHSLDALIGVAHYFNAMAIPGAQTFTHTLTREVDGKTNGPMLAMLMLGAGKDSGGLLSRIAAGGFFGKSAGFTQVADWAQDPNNQDLYKATARSMVKLAQRAAMESPEKAALLQAVYEVTGALTTADGGVTSEGRSLVKTPITALMFGSGINNVVDGMADDFLQALYDKVEAALNNEGDLSVLDSLALINRFLPDGQKLDVAMDQEAATKQLTKAQANAVKAAFKSSFGEVIEQTLKREFHTFIAIRDAVNNAANTAFELYDLAFEYKREQKLKYLMANGQLPYEKVTRNGVVSYVPAMDLSAPQLQEIRDELKFMEPVIHSAWTKLSGDTRDNGIFLAKNGQQISDDLSYMTTSKFAPGYFPKGSPKTKTNYGMENSPMAPGVAAIILAIHSTDSYIASQAYSKLQALNVHDAEIVAAQDAKAVAKALNEATYEVMGEYSVSDEITQALERTATGFFEVFKDIDPKSELAARYKRLSNQSAKAYMRKTMGELDWDWYNAQPQDGVGLVLDYAVRASRHADKTRLTALSEMAAVDQYPMLEGNHVVSPQEQQANAERAAQAALRSPDAQVLEASKVAKDRFRNVKAQQESAAASSRKRDTQLALPEPEVQKLFDPNAQAPVPSTVSVLTQPEALVLDLIERAQADGNDAVARVSEALDQQTGFNLEQALASVPEIEATEALAALQAEANRAGLQSVWGEVGPARIPSDPRWVDFFIKAGDQVSARQVAKQALRLLDQMPKGRTASFYREVLVQVARGLPAGVTVTMLTPNHPASEVGAAPVSNARGWYTTEGMKEGRIFLKSPSFTDSGLTTETIIHELIHAAVALQIENPANAEVKALVGNLESLLKKAQAYAAEQQITGFEDALSSVHELVAWGMTNLRFQQEVLNQISVPAPKGNSLITGMRQFLETIRGILFRGSQKSEAEQQTNGLSVLVASVSGVMAQAQKSREASQQQRELTLAQASSSMAEMSSLEILEALPGTQDPVLDHLLSNVVQKVHGPFGAWFAQVAENRPLTPLEVFNRAVNENFMPFSSETLSQGFQLDEKQSFVLEQVELVMRETLNADPVAYKELAKVWKEAGQRITPEEFLEGDWSLAAPESRAAAVAKHNFVFRIQANDRKGMTNHLSRFAALAMVHPGLREKLQFETDRPAPVNPQGRLGDTLKMVWDHVVDTAHGLTLGVRGGDVAGSRIEGLMMHLVDAETRRQELLARGRAGILDAISELTDGLNFKVAEKVEQAAQLPFLQNNKFAAVRAAAALAETTAAGRLDHLTAAIKQGNHEMGKVREGILASAVTEVQGAWDKATKVAQMLLRETKRLENMRLSMIDNTRANVMAAFKHSGEYLTKSAKAALTQVTLRTDMASLLDRFTVAELDAILADPSSYAATLEADLTALGGPHLNFYLASAKALGYQMAWGVAPAENVMLNAHNIAHLGGTQHAGKVDVTKADAALAILDPLITLYALQYSDGNQLAEVREVLRVENQRQDGNGIEFILGLHKAMKQEALEALFHGSPTLMQKGYTPEIYNPNITLEVVNESRAAELEAIGYTKVHALPKDRTDPRAEQQYLMRIKDGGQARRVTGTLSFTGERAQGSTVHAGLSKAGYTGVFKKNAQMTAEIRARNAKAYERLSSLGAGFDPRKEAKRGPFYVPVVNERGEIVNYRYMMSEQQKDALLERDNVIEDVLGMLVGQTADKQTSKDHNRVIVQALKDQYDAEYQEMPHSYVRVAPDSVDPQLKEHWDLLPEDTKQAAIEIWGKAEIMVRTDLVNINFGYRKMRFSNVFQKDAEERNVAETIFVNTLQAVFGEKAYLRMRQGSMAAEGLVTAVKDNVVIKNLTTLWFNVISNVTVLWWHGVPMADMARLHKEGIQGALDYQRDRNELTQLQQMLDVGYVQGRVTEIEQRILELQDAIARNPVKELIDAGLMPTIVEDVDVHQNQFSPFKSFMEEKAQPYLDMVPASLMGVAKTLYMTHDTPAYKALSKSTQLSDFVARYTLFQYLTTRKRNPMAKVDAIQQASDMFVNYDIPTTPQMQYLNDKGVLMFTKYYMRIQRAIYHLYREHPGRAIALKMLSMALGDLSTIQDSWFTQQLLRNPLREGPVQMLDAWDEPILLKTMLSPFR